MGNILIRALQVRVLLVLSQKLSKYKFIPKRYGFYFGRMEEARPFYRIHCKDLYADDSGNITIVQENNAFADHR